MGDRFYLNLKCVYCGLISEVYYAPTCGFYDFKCRTDNISELSEVQPVNVGCGKINFITATFEVKKVEEVTEDDVIQAFEMASTASHSLSAIKKEAKQYLKQLKRGLKK